MHTVEKKILLPYSHTQMFMLVNDIKSYPEFLPWCTEAEVFKQSFSEDALEHTIIGDLEAKIHIGFKGISQFFHTKNTFKKTDTMHSINLEFVDGPFKHLQGHWLFKVINNPHNQSIDIKACEVEFKLEYQFDSKLLEIVIGPVFHFITKTFVDCFVQRAKNIYGKANLSQ